MPAKLEMVRVYEKGNHNPQWSHDTINAWRIKKSYISVFTWLMTTKHNMVMAYGTGPP